VSIKEKRGYIAVTVQTAYAVCRKLSWCMSDRLRAGKPPQYFTSHPGQLSLLPLARLEMSTSQSAATI